MDNEKSSDLITASKARALLGVGPSKMSKLIKDKTLRCWKSPLDARVKLFSQAEVEALKTPREEVAA